MTFPIRGSLYLPTLIALAVCGGAFASAAHAQDRVKPYRYQLAFNLTLPADWTTRHDVGGAAVVVLSPLSGQDDGFRENLNVSVESVPGGRSLAEVYRRDFAAIRDGLEAFEVIKTEEVTVGALAARRVVYEHEYGGQRLRALAYLVLAGRRCYTLTGTAPADRFEEAQPAFEQMVHSFRLE